MTASPAPLRFPPPLLRGNILKIHDPNTITILSIAPIYAKTCVNIGGIITPNIHSFDADERDAAKYVVKQMKYRYWEKYAILDKNADVRCGDEYIWKWMVDNRLAVRENTPVPKNWKEYRETYGFPYDPIPFSNALPIEQQSQTRKGKGSCAVGASKREAFK